MKNTTKTKSLNKHVELIAERNNYMSHVTASTILHEAARLKERKQADYQGDMWKEEDYFPYGNNTLSLHDALPI